MSLLITKPSKQNELISNEVQELINYRPHWIIRKGNVIFFFIIALLLTSTWFIAYPDVVKGSMKLVAINAPKLQIAKTDGRLQKLLVTNEQEVKEGQPLAFLQSTASHIQVLSLQSMLNRIEFYTMKDSLNKLLFIHLPTYDHLGEIQTSYQDFLGTLNETLQTLANGYYQQKKKALQNDLFNLSAIQTNTQIQKDLLSQDFELQKKEYKINEKLAKDKVIAPLELYQNRSKFISKEHSLAQISAQVINNQIAEQNKKKEILELQKYINDQQQKFRSSLYTLKSKLEQWIQQYVISAPENGIVLFTSFLQENQLIFNGQEIFYLQPPQTTYYGQMLAPQSGLGKIKIGQHVLIRVASYPSNEFGYLTGEVAYISNIPTAKDSFLIKVDLPKGLQTNYNKSIIFRNNLAAQSEVMTDNRRLFERFVIGLRNLGNR
ncbi:MAG: HlyD family secretion protein [Chitinophagaceae bacterium]|nr:HlyD family secretion protein [Chitinophagaceae bacterium]